jgi:long-chain acyl-CoA synthetase
LFSYTSGTTGDSKGVKITHKNLMGSSLSLMSYVRFTPADAVISYLPYPHVYEQMHLYNAVALSGAKVGFYSGNPANLIADVATLKPTYLPAVPRVWNKIYSMVSAKTSGCNPIIGGRVQ